MPEAGDRMLLDAIIRSFASSWASWDSGTWTAIWSPSKSALKGRAGQRVQLDGLALDEDGLEGLDAEAVQRGRAVEQDRMVLGDELQDVPDLRADLLEHALGGLEREALGLHQLADDERLEKLEGHLLGAGRTG